MNENRKGEEFTRFCNRMGVSPFANDATISEALFGALNRAMGACERPAPVIHGMSLEQTGSLGEIPERTQNTETEAPVRGRRGRKGGKK